MYYYDDFGKAFKTELGFHEYLDEIDKRAQWLRIPAKKLRVLTAAEAPDAFMEMPGMRDILEDTKKHTGLLLQCPQGIFPVGKTAVGTLKDRARVKGTALMEVKTAVLASILNECLKVAKGNALLRISEGKVRGVLSGDEADYAIISMPELFMIASAYISAEQEAAFCHGYADHYLAQITWQMSNSELTKTYGELMEEHGKKPFGDIKAMLTT